MTKEKQRHGCLTVFLAAVIVGNIILVLKNLLIAIANKEEISNIPSWLFLITVLICMLNLVFFTAIFRWKKWGFFGVLGMSIITLATNLYFGANIVTLLTSFAGVIILFLVLQIGQDKKGWSQLE